MVLIDKQSVDERHEVLFFRCSSCGATMKRVIDGVAFAPLGQLHGVSS
jgi:predicted nucleic acid-binding Zn ribbon protein